MASKFAHLNYEFTLNDRELLDAFFVGNETRFANDPADEALSNVEAAGEKRSYYRFIYFVTHLLVRHVDGNNHIAYYTSEFNSLAGQSIMTPASSAKMIKKGKELLLSYGDAYWSGTQPEKYDQSAPQTERASVEPDISENDLLFE